jgi:hypothetical protein
LSGVPSYLMTVKVFDQLGFTNNESHK